MTHTVVVEVPRIPFGWSVRSGYPGSSSTWYLKVPVLPPIYCCRYNACTDRLERRWWACTWLFKTARPGVTMRWGWMPL